ncbi:protealysin inhibitor emfourin [Dactylosporangium sp. NPDC005572]|uniref:protealysin inhibitor emfourin n=1 Tax=Dactylosporangium sp. NPDC005572 TaxID=3156889 RepID=UPI0033A63727
MKVTLAAHGGQAAAIHLRLPPRVMDADALPEQEARELARLVEAATTAPAAEEERPGRARDAMSYTITVEDGGQPIFLTQSDTTMSPEFAALLGWLERHLATQ